MKAHLLLLLFAVAASVTQGLVFRSDGCPEPYERLDATRCILADPFKTRKYDEALDYCKGHGGVLVNFENCTDQILVWDYIHNEVGLKGKSYWLGATDQAKEGMWVWSHNQDLVPLGNPFWEHGKPTVSTSYNCAILHASYNHRWSDYSCTSSANTLCLRDG